MQTCKECDFRKSVAKCFDDLNKTVFRTRAEAEKKRDEG